MSAARNKKIVTEYIDSVWNGNDIASLDRFIADDYRDFSFLPSIPPDRAGLRLWIENTSQAFDHKTVIESLVAEGDEVGLRISFVARHKGKWRSILPTGREVKVKGFRFFKLRDGKIVAHWALLDGEALQTALTDEYQGCELPR